MMSYIQSKNILLVFSLFVFFAIILLNTIPVSGEGDLEQLGAEYGNIAESIVNGNGYANVFAEDSGPTAWMLPLNTWLFALIFYLFGIKTVAAIHALMVINSLFWALTAFVLIKISSLTQYGHYRFLVVPILLLIIFLNPQRSIGDLMDVSLFNLLNVCCVYSLYTFIYFNKSYFSLFVLAVVLPLSAPGLFLAFALVIAVYFVYGTYDVIKTNRKNAGHSVSWRYHSKKLAICLSVGFVALLTFSAWGVRNYIAMGKFIPSKSNLWYEFYQANVADDDGILDKRTLLLYHPNNQGEFIEEYLKLGEVKFVDYFKSLSKESFDADHYLQRVLNRLKFSFLYNPNTSFYLKAGVKDFTEDDLKKLEEQALIIDNKWIALHLEEADFLNIISRLELDEQEVVVEDWLLHRNQYKQAISGILPRLRAFIMPVLPIVCIMIGLSVSTIRKSGIFILTLITYGSLLLPYEFISVSNRYIFFSQSLQAIFVFFVTGFLLNALKEQKL